LLHWLFLAFLIVPLAEVYVLIQVGSVVGAGWTIFLVVFTAVLGAVLVRIQGLSAIDRVRRALAADEMPALELVEGLFLLVAGVLLLTPGFITDAVGFACLTPPLRRGVIRALVRRGVVRAAAARGGDPGGGQAGGRVIDGQGRVIDE
jgi:UPF0716 protein FxsA